MNGESNVIRRSVLAFLSIHSKISIPNIDFPKVYNLIILGKTRRQYDSKLLFTPQQINKAKELSTYPLAQKLYQFLPQSFTEGVTENEILSLSMILSTTQTFAHHSLIEKEIYQTYHEETEKVIQYLSSYFDLDGLFDDRFYLEFSNYLFTIQLKYLFQIPSDAELIAPGTRLGLFTNDLCALFALYFYQTYNVFLHESDLTLAYSIFNRSLYENQSFFNQQKVIVSSRYGIYFTENLALRVQETYGKFIKEILPLEYTELFHFNYEDIDIIATDMPKSILPDFHGLPVININFYRTNNDLSHLQKYITTLYKKDALTIFTENSLHKCEFQHIDEFYEQLYRLIRDEIGDKDRFFRDLQLRDSIISFEREKGIALITPLALRLAHPIFEVFVNKKPIQFKNQKCSIFIFYQQGDGSHKNTQLTSYLLKQFIHRSESYINSFYRKNYNEIISNFK